MSIRQALDKSSDIAYTLKRSLRARHIHITVRRSGEVIVTAPFVAPLFLIRKFVSQTEPWIKKKISTFKKLPPQKKISPLPAGRRDFVQHKGEALRILTERLEYFNTYYGFSYKKVIVRNQKTRWGSCSRNGTISFNYKLAYLPDEVRDYVVVHELCHLEQFDHSKKFWDLVARVVPEYKKVRGRLRGLSVG